MSGYRFVETRLFRPTAAASGQGEWVNLEPVPGNVAYGVLRELPSEAVRTSLGQAARQRLRWRGPVYDRHRPEPGWEVEIQGQRYRIITAARTTGRVWRLDLERQGDGG